MAHGVSQSASQRGLARFVDGAHHLRCAFLPRAGKSPQNTMQNNRQRKKPNKETRF